jgi:carboxymethylenebutenolidase
MVGSQPLKKYRRLRHPYYERINAGIPDFETALKKASVEHEIHIYKGAKHGFLNNTKPWYNEEAAKLAWKRTIDFFKKKLEA